MALAKTIEEIIEEDSSGLLSIHPSWVRIKLSDVADVMNGFAFPSANFNPQKGLPLVRIRDVLSGTTETYYDGPFEEAYLVQNGDFLIGMDGDFNSAFWKSGKALLNQRVCKITAQEEFYDKAFLAYALPGYLKGINQNTSSVTVKHLSSKTVESILLPLPPRNEQIRIVEKIEELFTDLDNGVEELKAAQVKLGQYRQSLLKSAVDGSLTEKWREENASKISETGEQFLARILKERRERWEKQKLAEFKAKGKNLPKDWQKQYPEPVQPDTSDLPDLPDGWVWGSLDMLGDIVSGVTKGTKRKTVVETREVPYLRVANVQRGYLDLSEIKTIAATENDIEKYTLIPGDILFNEGGDLDKLGRGWVWYGEVDGCIHQNHVFRMRPFIKDLVSELISHHGNTFGRHWFQSAGKQTTNLASINSTILKSFPVPVGPLLEQQVALESLNEELSNIDIQSEVVASSLGKLEAQRKNILKAAFAGELVQQDSGDEPASKLLERIREAREEQASQATTARRSGPQRTKLKQEVSEMIRKLEDVLSAAGDWLPAQEAFQRCGIGNGAETDQIEILYSELRELDKAGRLMVEAVTNSQGIKQYDRIKLVAEG